MSVAQVAPEGRGFHSTLDAVYDRLVTGDVDAGLDSLFSLLNCKRRSESRDGWRSWVESCALKHPVAHVLQGEPFTSSAYGKPRGFAGDAGTLDYMYAALLPELRRQPPAFFSPLSASVHGYITARRPSAHAVAGRCRFFGRAIDETASVSHSGQGKARVLAIAAGHFRERFLSRAIQDGSIGEVVALDQDSLAVAEMRSSCLGTPVTPVKGSVRGLLSGALRLGQFDLVYAAGLFDYLSEKVAVALLESSMGLLHPGGRVIVVNFVPEHPDRGFMESYMDWRLTYRSEAQMKALFEAMPQEGRSARTWTDPTGSLAFLEITRS